MYDRAFTEANRATELNPQCGKAFLILAEVYYCDKKYIEAE